MSKTGGNPFLIQAVLKQDKNVIPILQPTKSQIRNFVYNDRTSELSKQKGKYMCVSTTVMTYCF